MDRVPALKQYRLHLTLEVVEAGAESLSVMAHSTLSPRPESSDDGAGLLLLFDLPEAHWQLVPWITRQGEVTLAEAAAHTGQDTEATRAALEALASQGVVQKLSEGAETRYRARYTRRRTRVLPDRIWDALDEGSAKREVPGASEAAPQPSRVTGANSLPSRPAPRASRLGAERLHDALLSDKGRLLAAASPVALAFLITAWLFYSGNQSFTGLLNFTGLILVSILGGIFPVLLLATSRRKGEHVPGFAWPALGSLPVQAVIYLIYLSILLLHGLVIWQSLPARAAALAAAALAVASTVVLARRGAFTPRAVVELRETAATGEAALGSRPSAPGEERGGRSSSPVAERREPRAVFSVMADGRPLVAAARLDSPEGERELQAASGDVPALSSLRGLTFTLPPTRARELKIWTHRVTPDGDSEPLPALVEVRCGSETRQVDLGLSRGQILLPISGEPCHLQFTFNQRRQTSDARRR
jgi:hypothetical protein